jgi:hypothetical protein
VVGMPGSGDVVAQLASSEAATKIDRGVFIRSTTEGR